MTVALRDVVVAGAGPAGAAAALALARRGRDVALVDDRSPRAPGVGEMLGGDARTILRRLGVDLGVVASAAVPGYGAASVWSGDALLERPSILDPYGESRHLDRARFDSGLVDAAVAAGAGHVPGRVVDCRAAADGWLLSVRVPGRAPAPLHATAVVAATGRSAGLTGRLGARRVVRDRLVGVAAHFPAADGDGWVLVEAAPYGWWYSGPLPPDRLVVILMTDSDLCRTLGATRPDRWNGLLDGTCETRRRVAAREPVGAIRAFGAASHRLRREGFERPWIAVGDAALAVDPLSASGIERALRSGILGGEAIARWLDGDEGAALAYETWLDAELSRYLVERQRQYAMQTRWREEPFWRRRTGAVSGLGASDATRARG